VSTKPNQERREPNDALPDNDHREARLHRNLLAFNNSTGAIRDRAFNEIKRGGWYRQFELIMLKAAHLNGGTDAVWNAHIMCDYVGLEMNAGTAAERGWDGSFRQGVHEDVERYIGPPDGREGALEGEIRSATFDVFCRAAAKFDPARRVPFTAYFRRCAWRAVQDIKRKQPGGIVGKPAKSEATHSAAPVIQLDADAIARRILTARSWTFLERWCCRPDVDAIDCEILVNNLIRPAGETFRSLAEIGARHGVSKQAVALRRRHVERDLVGGGSDRGSDGDGWLSTLEGVRIVCIEGRSCPDALIDELDEARARFAGGTGYNLYWSGPSFLEAVDTSLKRAGITGTPQSVYEMLSPAAIDALDTMKRTRDRLGGEPPTQVLSPRDEFPTAVAPKGYVEQHLLHTFYYDSPTSCLMTTRINPAWQLADNRRSYNRRLLGRMPTWRGALLRARDVTTGTQRRTET
jgi:hypothetical protein